MLTEIFQTISDQITSYLESKNVKTKNLRLVTGPSGKKKNRKIIRLELLRFGQSKNSLHGSPSDKLFYAFTFFITATTPYYSECLELTEHLCDHFERKPFIQVKIKEKEYEVAISPMELTIDELNRFWLAQKHPQQPILFYQARISEV
jgi:hypothetical protein